MLMLWGLGGKAGFDINAQKADEDVGDDLTGDILSFGGIVFGSFTGVSQISLRVKPVCSDFVYNRSGRQWLQTTTVVYL